MQISIEKIKKCKSWLNCCKILQIFIGLLQKFANFHRIVAKICKFSSTASLSVSRMIYKILCLGLTAKKLLLSWYIYVMVIKTSPSDPISINKNIKNGEVFLYNYEARCALKIAPKRFQGQNIKKSISLCKNLPFPENKVIAMSNQYYTKGKSTGVSS